MGTYPSSPRSAFVAWCEEHKQVFVDNAEDIGLTPSQATLFLNATNVANGDITAQGIARTAAMAATVKANGSVGDLRTIAGDTVRSIKAFAELQAKPDTVYTLAQIPPPATPTPMPPPGKPTNLTVTLEPGSGQLMLKWKCENPTGSTGTSYLVRRRLPGQTTFTVIGASGIKEFIDATLSAGPDSVTYTIQGLRGALQGLESDWFTINFGSQTGGGGFSVSTMANPGVNASDAALVDAIVNSKAMGNGRKTAISRKP